MRRHDKRAEVDSAVSCRLDQPLDGSLKLYDAPGGRLAVCGVLHRETDHRAPPSVPHMVLEWPVIYEWIRTDFASSSGLFVMACLSEFQVHLEIRFKPD